MELHEMWRDKKKLRELCERIRSEENLSYSRTKNLHGTPFGIQKVYKQNGEHMHLHPSVGVPLSVAPSEHPRTSDS